LVKGEDITPKHILLGIPLWLTCGLAWGLTMKWRMNKKGKEEKAHNTLYK
jgi:hypothetical protein